MPQIRRLSLLLTVSLWACAEDPQAPVLVDHVVITPAQSSLTVGETVSFTAVPKDASGATLENRSVQWTSGAPEVATVSSTGVATGVQPGGPVSVSATIEGRTAIAQLTVMPAAVSSVSVEPSSKSIVVGASQLLVAVLRDARGAPVTGRTVAWSTSNQTIATVSNAGQVTAISVGGPVAITATSEGRQASAQVTVIPVPVAEVRLAAPATDMNAPDSVQLSVQVSDASGKLLTDRSVTWSSEAMGVATVDAKGLVRSVGAGTVIIRASVEGVLATIAITFRGMTHRWKFDESGGAGTVFRDDVSGATASIVQVGTSDASAISGQVTLPGGPASNADYVALPAGTLQSMTDATVEIWATLHSLKNWARIVQIGSSPENNLFAAWSQGVNPQSDRAGFVVGGVEHRVDNTLAPFDLNMPHHIVMAIDEGGGANGTTRISLYRDGAARGTFDTPYRLRDLVHSAFWLGRAHGGDNIANASYEEVRIHNRVYPPAQIQQFFIRGAEGSAPLTSVRILPPTGMGDTVRGINVRFNVRTVGFDAYGRAFPLPGATYTSRNPTIATVSLTGEVHALMPGRFELTATLPSGSSAARLMTAADLTWTADVVLVEDRAIPASLAAIDSRALHRIPVIEIRVFPTRDGYRLDSLAAPDFYSVGGASLADMHSRTDHILLRTKYALEEGSRFHGYAFPLAPPSITMDVRRSITYYGIAPAGPQVGIWNGFPQYLVNYTKLFGDLGVLADINRLGVKQVWMSLPSWRGEFPSIPNLPSGFDPTTSRGMAESAMSNPSGLCISNSLALDCQVLPRANHTYVVFGTGPPRGWSCAVHNHGHQFERIFNFFDRDNVFANNFTKFARAGHVHSPPNTSGDYDYRNSALVAADIKDWRPAGGATSLVNVQTWEGVGYKYPDEDNCGGTWLTYWFQNFPGRDNVVELNGRRSENWWDIYANFDEWLAQRKSLIKGAAPAFRAQGATGGLSLPVWRRENDYPLPPLPSRKK